MLWPLPRNPQAAGLARRYLSQAVPDMPAEVLAVAQLLVTEVVTNALRHGSGPMTMQLLERPSGMRVEVHDAGVGLPRQRATSPLDTGGRGLQIVDALATSWGVTPASARSGKTVWFEIAAPALVPF